MTQITHPAPRALSLEDEARALGQRYSRTSTEREAIALDADALLTRYGLQGGKFGTKWLETHMGVTHSTAVNLRRAGLAQKRGAKAGQGVSKLAQVGRWLEAGKALTDAQHLADDAEARKKAAEDANIGVASVKYSASMSGEMATAYQSVVNLYQSAGLTPPNLPELTVSMAKLAAKATPQQVREVELGVSDEENPNLSNSIGLPQGQQENVKFDFYTWLSAQPGVCDVPGCVEPHIHLHHVLTDKGRKAHDLRQYPTLRLCLRHHQTGKVESAHGVEGERGWMERHWGSRERVLELLWERAARYAEYLRGSV